MNISIVFRFFLILVFGYVQTTLTMDPASKTPADIAVSLKGKNSSEESCSNEYDSDSEDEDAYKFKGYKHLTFFDQHKAGERCIVISRGIHFSPSKIDKQHRSTMRRHDDTGEPIFSNASYDQAHVEIGEEEHLQDVREKAVALYEAISGFSPKERNKFQEMYTNNYDGFHKRLGTCEEGGIFSTFASQKNPQVSTSEDFKHSGKYAAGLKFLGTGVEKLNPEYDKTGKPRHPYLGKILMILINESMIGELDPYFVVWAYANNFIKVFTHYTKNILTEREVSFPGFIPEKCTVFCISFRVPSFEGSWHSWHIQKYGLTKRQYNMKKRILTTGKVNKNDTRPAEEVRQKNTTLLIEQIVTHLKEKLKSHVEQDCKSRGITLIYKDLHNGFGSAPSSLVNATAYRNSVIRSKKK